MVKYFKYFLIILIFSFGYQNASFANTTKVTAKTEEIKKLFTNKNYTKAISELHKLSVNGDLDASILLAEIFYKGHIAKQNIRKASQYLFLGVKAGHSSSAHNLLKIIFQHGNKVTESELKLILETSEKEFPESTKDIQLQISRKGIIKKDNKTIPPIESITVEDKPNNNDQLQQETEKPKNTITEPEVIIDKKPKKDQIFTRKGWNNKSIFWDEKIDIVGILKSGGASGSGFAVNDKGVIVSNEHVVDGCKRLTVIYKGNHTARAKVLYKNKRKDLSILKINHETPQFLSLSTYEPPLGIQVTVGGYPDIYAYGMNIKINSGIISGKASSPNPYFNKNDFNTYFDQIDASIQPGNSGSPVVNQNGNIVGVAAASAKVDLDDYLPQNINWMVNFNTLNDYLKQHKIKFLNYNNNNDISLAKIASQLEKSAVSILCELK